MRIFRRRETRELKLQTIPLPSPQLLRSFRRADDCIHDPAVKTFLFHRVDSRCEQAGYLLSALLRTKTPPGFRSEKQTSPLSMILYIDVTLPGKAYRFSFTTRDFYNGAAIVVDPLPLTAGNGLYPAIAPRRQTP